jgi:hypothetical protein
MTKRTRIIAACLAAAAVTVAVAGVASRHVSDGHASQPAADATRYRMTAALTGTGAPPPVGHPNGSSQQRPRGVLTATLDRDFQGQGGHALRVKLATSAPGASPVAVHIHLGRPDTTGREVVTLCEAGSDDVPSCAALAGGVFLWWGAWMLDPVLRGPTYVDVHTAPDGPPALRGAIVVEPLEQT